MLLKKCNLTKNIYRGLATKVSHINGQDVRLVKNQAWISTIGLEVHAQLKTKTKLFSRASTAYGGSANTQVSFFDASTPGTLPVINEKAVELAVKAGLALNCQVNPVSTFDRKHYFYADLPAGYQITQQRRPIASSGYLDVAILKSSTVRQTYFKRSNIIQLQLEQDSGKSLHDEDAGVSLIDLNRCGIGLIEIVFGPDLFHGEEAGSLIKELSLILQALDVCTCAMDTGALRVDANVSVRPIESDVLGIRTEVKNINSIRGVVNAIEHEIDRQIHVLEKGGIIVNETRSYDGNLKRSVAMRDKEVKQDYRFMPEPNLPPLRLENIDKYRKTMPRLPQETREYLVQKFDLPLEIAVRLVNEPDLLVLFENAQNHGPISCQKTLANLMLLDLVGICNKLSKPLKNCIKSETLVAATNMKISKEITHSLILMALESFISGEEYSSFQALLEAKGWLKIFRNEAMIEQHVSQVLDENPKIVKKYRKTGNVKLLNEILLQTTKLNPVFDGLKVKEIVCKKLTTDNEK